MSTMENHPPLPGLSIKRILAHRDKLVSKLVSFVGGKLEGDLFHSFVDSLHEALPEDILKSTVHNSIKNLLTEELTQALLLETCWRMAGNIPTLMRHRPVTQWLFQSDFEWIPASVSDVFTSKQHKQLVNTFTFQSLAGTLVPRKLMQTWSLKKTHYLATYRNEKGLGFGFCRSRINSRGEQRSQNLLSNVHQFYGLQCFLLLDPKRSQQDPFIVEIGHSYATVLHNRKLIAARDRQQTPCLKGFPATHECFCCPYGIDRCELATHNLTYIRSKCKCCEKLSFLNVEETDYLGFCTVCADTKRML